MLNLFFLNLFHYVLYEAFPNISLCYTCILHVYFISTYLMLLGLFHSYQLYPWNYKFLRARNLFYVFFSCQLLAKNLAYKKALMFIVWTKVMWKWIKNHLKVKGWWGHICTHGLFMSMYGKNHHNIVK